MNTWTPLLNGFRVMSNCGVALMSARPAEYRMPGSSSHRHYSSPLRSYGNSYDTYWKNYVPSSTRHTSSFITDYKPSYSPVSRTSSMPLSVQAGVLTHNFGSKFSFSSKHARERCEGSESSSTNSTSKLLIPNKSTLEKNLNGYTKYLGSKRSNIINSTSVGDVTKDSQKFHTYNLNTLPMSTNLGKTPLRSMSSSMFELESTIARKSSLSSAGSQNRLSHIDSFSNYRDKRSPISFSNSTSWMAVEGKFSTLTSVDGRRSVSVSSPLKERNSQLDQKEVILPKRQNLGLIGLRNIGNTCFLNSVLQCLSNTKPLLDYILNAEFSSDINICSSRGGALMKAFAEVICDIWQSGNQAKIISPTVLKREIEKVAPQFIGLKQHDAQEFLQYLLEGLHKDINKVKFQTKSMPLNNADHLSSKEKSIASWNQYHMNEKSKVVDIFVGQLKSTLTCIKCRNTSITFDPFWDLSLPIPNVCRTSVSLTQCFDVFTAEEVLSGEERPECSVCKGRQKSTKRLWIQKFPNILVLHLKRFSSYQEGSLTGKLNLKVDFPIEDLNLQLYSADANTTCTYNLYGVVNHSGTTRSGHYTAMCKNPYSEKWNSFDDSRVSELSPQRIVNSSAYILFYELVKNE